MLSNKAVRAEMAETLDRLNAEFDRLNSLHFDSKLKPPKIEFSLRKTFGGYYQQRSHRIVLSWQAYREHGWDETANTFRHEMAHIVHMNHRREFWELAVRLGVTRKYALEPLKRSAAKVLTYECPGCLKRIQRRRRMDNSSCARCDKKYNPRFKFRLVDVAETAANGASTSNIAVD